MLYCNFGDKFMSENKCNCGNDCKRKNKEKEGQCSCHEICADDEQMKKK